MNSRAIQADKHDSPICIVEEAHFNALTGPKDLDLLQVALSMIMPRYMR